MKTSTTYTDSRINRNNNFGGFCELAQEIVLDKTGINKKFEGGEMSYNEFKSTAYRYDWKDSEVKVVMNFNTNEITITVDAPEQKKSKLDEEMEQWEARANDEFGTILKVINEACADYFYAEPDEYGILTTPLSHYITAYALDGNRKYTAKAIYSILESYDILEDGAIIALANKMKRLAA